MKKQLAILFLSFFFVAVLMVSPAPSAGQQKAGPGQSPAADAQNPSPKDKDEAVRISVTLVQIDAVVTDGKGRHVTDLKPGDFEVSEDGKRQYSSSMTRTT